MLLEDGGAALASREEETDEVVTDGIDPLTFLQSCADGNSLEEELTVTPPPKPATPTPAEEEAAAAAAEPPLAVEPPISPVASACNSEVSTEAAEEAGSESDTTEVTASAAPASSVPENRSLSMTTRRGGVRTERRETKDNTTKGETKDAMRDAASTPTTKGSSDQGDGPETPPREGAATTSRAAEPPALVSSMLNDIAFEELANELETWEGGSLGGGGGGGNILSELDGLCEIGEIGGGLGLGAAGADPDRVSLLHDLSNLAEGDEADVPMTFAGFGDAAMMGEAPRGAKSKRKSGTDGPAGKKSKKAVKSGGHEWVSSGAYAGASASSASSGAAAAGAAAAAAAAGAAGAAALSAQDPATMNAMLPAANSGSKFLPGAVQTPAPAPTKASLGGQPISASSLGRTFSWQPIKFPTYK